MYARTTRSQSRAIARTAEQGSDALRMRAFVVLAVACAIALGTPGRARAGWPLAQASSVTLEFGAVYSAGEDGGARHRGTDIAAEAGARVLAPLSGEVSFVGSVPGVGGGRVKAVTIETARGKITLLPLESTSVSRGAAVAEGEPLGSLAAAGDASSPESHLHVSARTGDLYVDPLGFLAPPAAASGGSGAGGSVVVGAADSQAAGEGAGAGVTIVEGVNLAPGASGAGAARPRTHAKTAAQGELAPGVSIAVRGAASSARAVEAGQALGHAGAGAGAGVRALATGSGAVQATVLTRDGVVVAAGAAEAAAPASSRAWLAGAVGAARTHAARSLRVAGLVLLGVLGALGGLWPLWRRGARKDPGKVLVRAIGEDVAAAPGR